MTLRDERLSQVRGERAELEAQYRVSSDNSSGLTNVESGVIGSMVTVAVFLIGLVAIWAVGGISFGRGKKNRAESVGSRDSLVSVKALTSHLSY